MIKYRSDEQCLVKKHIFEALETNKSKLIYVYGTTGLGKTMTMRAAIVDVMSDHDYAQFIYGGKIVWIDFLNAFGLEEKKEADLFVCLEHELGAKKRKRDDSDYDRDDHHHSTPMESFFERFTFSGASPEMLVLVFDEMDTARVKENLDFCLGLVKSPKCKIVIVCVANRLDLAIGDGIVSIEFKPYTAEQLFSIVGAAEQALSRPVPVSEEHVKMVCRSVSKYGGDCRRALSLVTALAENQSSMKTLTDVVEFIKIHQFPNDTVRNIAALPFHHKLILCAAIRSGKSPLEIRMLRDLYRNACSDTGVLHCDSTFIQMTDLLTHYQLITITPARMEKKRKRGRPDKDLVRVAVGVETVKSALSKETVFSWLFKVLK